MVNDKVTSTSSNDKNIVMGGTTTTLSKDTTLTLCLAEEKLLKRLRQVGNGMFSVIVIDSEPVLVVVNGKVEILRNKVTI